MASVFILGATGYIGGALLVDLRSAYPNARITALVRKEADFPAVKAAGANSILHADHADLDQIRSASAQSDAVLNCADADDLPLTKAILAGLTERKNATGKLPVLLHTSGTGVLTEKKPEGRKTQWGERIWNDNNVEDIKSIPPEQLHREIDLEIFNANDRGDVAGYIIAPSTIYGISKGPVHHISQQVPQLIRTAVKRKETVYAGEGTNVWNNVHIDDLMALYLIVYKLALSGTDWAPTYGRFYFGSVYEHVWGELARELAPLLHARGLVENADAVSVPVEEEPQLTASNSRSRADRGSALGWKPFRKSVEHYLEEDIDGVMKGL